MPKAIEGKLDASGIEPLAQRVARGEHTAVAQALNLVEDRRAAARPLVARLLRALRRSGAMDRAHRVGITGPPGVGKSTLVAAIARALRTKTLGVLAVDPTSVRSGGALLGDRIRIAPHTGDAGDAGLFVRSLATAGELGGLAPSVPAGLLVLASAFDVAMVETVGVGQSETDVRHVVDTVVFVVQPGAGDALQYMKAGVMEVPDLLVVNKADQTELVRRTLGELRSALGSLRSSGISSQEIPLLQTSALDGTGVDELCRRLAAHRASLEASGELAKRRRAGTIAWGLRAYERRFGEAGVERAGGESKLEAAIAAGVDRGDELLDVVEELGRG